MGKLNIKNGTPVGSANLCKSCNWGQVVAGYRESDLLVICMNTSPNIVVPFTVFDCSEFSDKRKPTWDEMEKLAIAVDPARVSAMTRGFGTVTTIRADQDEDEVARMK
jgi:hypothetical protein